MSASWICCQLGAREHYAIPRALHHNHQLQLLIVDAWASPFSPSASLLSYVSQGLKERFHLDLSTASVQAFTLSLLQFELIQTGRRIEGWERTIRRNRWFQRQALRYLQSNVHCFSPETVLFSYSYAALGLFQFAQQQGWRTVLGQIDPGPLEIELVAAAQAGDPQLAAQEHALPSVYWQDWRQECALADRIVVNSAWSQQLLTQAKIEPSKLHILPLAYEPPKSAKNFQRRYPQSFSAERPLIVLFLGQIILRKGVAALLEAAHQLQQQPIEFWLVGSVGITPPAWTQQASQIHWIGSVPRSQAAKYYQQADVFLFPTLSDGFGLTQLEAQAWKLPIITSEFCGDVVNPGKNGLRLSEVTGDAIAAALHYCLANPKQLEVFSQHADPLDRFSLLQLQHQLQSLVV